MKSQIAVYNTHEDAVKAVQALKLNEFPMEHVSILAKADVIDDHVSIQKSDIATNAPAIVGAGAGTIIGLLTGIGVFAIPGLGLVYGAGALIGALVGFDLGLVGGGITSLLLTAGIDENKVVELDQHLKDGNYLVVVSGSMHEIERVKPILLKHNTHLQFVD